MLHKAVLSGLDVCCGLSAKWLRVSVRVSVVRARSARLRLGRRNAPDAVGVRTSFGGSWWGGSAPLRSAGVHGHDVVVRVTAVHT